MMTEEIKPEVLKKTQSALNKYIKKPPLTEKLLKKPPFRFLHDIVTSVIRETGFLNAVFTPEELIADNVKDRDSKVKFLTKLISAVKDSTGNNIKAKPGKIVAGLEVDKTLELLQAIAKGISNQTNGNKSVSNNQNENNKSTKDSSETIVTNNKSKTEGLGNQRTGDVKDTKKKDKKKDEPKEVIHNVKEKKKREKSERREKEEKQKLKEVKRRETFPPEEASTPKVSEVKKPESQEDNLLQSVEEPEPSNNEEKIHTGDLSKQSYPEVKEVDGDVIEKQNIVFKHKKSDKINEEQNNEGNEKEEIKNVDVKNKEEEQTVLVDKNKVEERNVDGDEPKKDPNGEAMLKRPTTRRASSRSLKQQIKKGGSIKEKDDTKINEGSNVDSVANLMKTKDNINDSNTVNAVIGPPTAVERPRTARRAPPVIKPPSARPPSARPGAPKTRDRGEVAVEKNKGKEDEAKEVVVITENEKNEDDKEKMVVLETQSLTLDEESNIEDISSAAEGVLVDILESEGGSDKKKQKASVDIEWEGGRREKRATWQKECDQLRTGIQALTRSTGPLGKLFDFLQEDVDLAARELAYWRQASAEYASQLLAEQRLTDDLLSEHRKKLVELEGQIEVEQEAIRAVKASILTNDKKIVSLISRVPQNQ